MNDENNLAEFNRLEQLLQNYNEDPKWYSNFFIALATEPLAVAVNPPWKALDEPPPIGYKLLIISDGENLDQPMLAVFTRSAHAETFCRNNVKGETFVPYEGPSRWILLQVPENMGVQLNPNMDNGFRIPPTLIPELQADIRDAIKRAQEAI